MLYDLTVPQFTKTLKNLNNMLGKAMTYAESKKFEMDVLLNARLAPDQFNFIRQVQIACDTAKLCGARLTGKEAPAQTDTEKTIAEVKARIESTLQFLNTLNPNDYSGAESKPITQPRWEGKYLTGYDYVLHHAVPNFYFHITTAYSILRHNGVEIGKKDFLGELPYKK